MLREFTVYRPVQIARFVKTLFKGEFSIAGIGIFSFDQGRVLLPDLKNKKMLEIMKEINNIILKQLQLAS